MMGPVGGPGGPNTAAAVLDLVALLADKEEMAKRIAALAEQEQAALAARAAAEARIAEAARVEKEVDARERVVSEREMEAQKRHADLAAKEQEMGDRLSAFEAASRATEDRQNRRHEELERRHSEQEERHASLTEREEKAEADARAAMALKAEWDRRMAKLEEAMR